METDKILLEIYGKVEHLSGNVESMKDKLVDYCTDNKKQHEAMWGKLDKHTGYFRYFFGAFAVVGFIWAYSWEWIKMKYRGQ